MSQFGPKIEKAGNAAPGPPLGLDLLSAILDWCF